MESREQIDSELDLIEFNTESPEALRRRRIECATSLVFLPLFFCVLSTALRLGPRDETFPGMSTSEVAIFGAAAGLFVACSWVFTAIAQPRGKWRIDPEAFDWTKPGGERIFIRWKEIESVRLRDSKVRTPQGEFRLGLPKAAGSVAVRAKAAVDKRLLGLAKLVERAERRRFRWVMIPRTLLLAAALSIFYYFYLGWLIDRLGGTSSRLPGIVAAQLFFAPLFVLALSALWLDRWRFQWHETKQPPHSRDRAHASAP